MGDQHTTTGQSPGGGNSLLLDTNVFVVLIVGKATPEQLTTHRRTRSLGIDAADVSRLTAVIERYAVLQTTPTVLAEVSNLLSNDARLRTSLAEHIATQIETYHPTHTTIQRFPGDYLRLGVTDVAMLELALKGTTILTEDAMLYASLCSHGLRAMNFTHLRSLLD